MAHYRRGRGTTHHVKSGRRSQTFHRGQGSRSLGHAARADRRCRVVAPAWHPGLGYERPPRLGQEETRESLMKQVIEAEGAAAGRGGNGETSHEEHRVIAAEHEDWIDARH